MSVPLVVTPGMGVGPEVSLRALASTGFEDVVLAGRWSSLEQANQELGLPLVAVEHIEARPGALAVFDPGDALEACEVAAIRLAASACLEGRARALVTGPIHKARLVARGFQHRGHTDFLGHLCGVEEPVMAFVGGDLRVALVTHHVPLMDVGSCLEVAEIVRVVEVVRAALERDLGLVHPRISVCGLNPHAGEGGLLGREEIEIIGPACELARAAGAQVLGPVSAETAFLDARSGRTDMVVAMYHDQGLAPLKAVDFGRSVNWSLGLPLVRTSVDHGTADSLVGTGRASPDSMLAALRLARQILARREALPT